MKDPLDNLRFYQQSLELFDLCWDDCEILLKDVRGREIAKQLIRSSGSISANIEEGYGRGFGKEYPQYLRVSRGSARETKGWYRRSVRLLDANVINDRTTQLNGIIAMLSSTISTLEQKRSSPNSQTDTIDNHQP
jgi:four helix bundle protein